MNEISFIDNLLHSLKSAQRKSCNVHNRMHNSSPNCVSWGYPGLKISTILYSEYKNSDFFKPINGGWLSHDITVLLHLEVKKYILLQLRLFYCST